ncbi:MAG: hypothetical protein NT069_32810 [Planctomycetota bacterium]|nr:hypothetical protein [Planctomycetota bacterium]
MLLAVSATGCSSSVPLPTDGESAGAAASAEPKTESATDTPSPKGKKKGAKKKSGAHVGEIPKDAWPEIWFDNPSGVASETGNTKSVAVNANPGTDSGSTESKGTSTEKTPAAESPAKTAGGSPAAASGANWTTLLSADSFVDETKAIRSSLNAKMQSVGQFNGAYRDIQVDATVLAALAQIAPEYPDAPSWTKNAPAVRDVASEMSREANSVGDKYFTPTKGAFDKLETLMSGSVPPGVGESPAKMAFSSFASRLPLMTRFERARVFLKSNVNTADILKKESNRVIREAGILAALSEMILVGGYDSSDDELYQTLVTGVRDGALKVAAAARDQDFPAYTAALDTVYKSCTKCHSEFKNN